MGIGKRLEYLMKSRNTNANELAQKIGVRASTIYSLIQRDSNRMDINLIIKITHALGVTADELLSEDLVDESPKTLAAHFDGADFTPEEMEEIKKYADFVRSRREE